MAPISHLTFLENLRHFGVTKVVPYTIGDVPWYRHSRPRPWNPTGITVHDTVTGAMTLDRAARFCWAGKTGVPGPLYNVLVQQDTVALIGWGVSNNTGGCNGARYRLCAAGDMPLDRELSSPAEDDYFTANEHQYGIALLTPVQETTEVEIRTMTRVVAAICRGHGWSVDGGPGSVMGHLEATRRKGDPKLLAPIPDVGAFRREVRALLTSGPQEDDMALTEAEIDAVAKRVIGIGVGTSGKSLGALAVDAAKDLAAIRVAIGAQPDALVDAIAARFEQLPGNDAATVKQAVREVLVEARVSFPNP